MLDSSANVVERVDYLAYGLARHHFKADINGDGVGPDQSTVSTISGMSDHNIGGANYHAEADLDRDGDIDSADVSLASGSSTSLAAGEISSTSVNNDIGWCGYIYDKETGYYCVRNREYMPKAGRWMQRDPAGYMDSSNLYGYIGNNPIGGLDPSGLDGFGQQQVFYSFDSTAFGSGASGQMGRSEIDWKGSPQAISAVAKLANLSVTWAELEIVDPEPHRLTYAEYEHLKWTSWLDEIQENLSMVGYIPIIGNVADGINATIYLTRGDLKNALISGSTILIPKTIEIGGKLVTKTFKVGAEAVAKFGKGAGKGAIAAEVVDATKVEAKAIKASENTLECAAGQCFVAGTEVWTAEGQKPIEKIHSGECVWSFDVESQKWKLSEVQLTSDRDYDGDVATIDIQDENGTAETIRVTGGHPFWVSQGEDLDGRPQASDLPGDEPKPATSGKWTDARWLRVGDRFLTITGNSATIVGLNVRMERVKVYNLKVRRLHNYGVGEAGFLVHNANKCPLKKVYPLGEEYGTELTTPHDAHMVPQGMKAGRRGEIANELREHLALEKINIDSEEFNVFKAVDTTHYGTHRRGFLEWLKVTISDLHGEELRMKMRDIRKQLEDGTFVLPDKYKQMN